MKGLKIISLLVAIAIFIFGAYLLLPQVFLGLIGKNCGDELACMRNAFDSCTMAYYSRDVKVTQFMPGEPIGGIGAGAELSFTEHTEIQGIGLGGCRIFVKWTNAEGSLAEWKNAEMNCAIDPVNYSLAYDGLRKTCVGRLVEAYNPSVWNNIFGSKLPLC